MLNLIIKREKLKLKSFQTILSDDLERFREQYRNTLLSGAPNIDRIVNHLTNSSGKALRPMLTLLCARLAGGEPNEDTIRAAVIVELLHEATLVHDDVVDDADKRRGLLSISGRFQNKVAVLFGDYMLSKVLVETLASRNLQWLDILGDTAQRMAYGELKQAMHAKRLDLDEAGYINVISDKTASLFSAGCQIGGITVGLDQQMCDQLAKFGNHFGISFQIQDDMLDIFGDGSLLGKPTGKDFKERKMTLPLLAAMKIAPDKESRRIRARIRRGLKFNEMKLIREFIVKYEGDIAAEALLKDHLENAKFALDSFPHSQAKEQLINLTEYAITRKI